MSLQENNILGIVESEEEEEVKQDGLTREEVELRAKVLIQELKEMKEVIDYSSEYILENITEQDRETLISEYRVAFSKFPLDSPLRIEVLKILKKLGIVVPKAKEEEDRSIADILDEAVDDISDIVEEAVDDIVDEVKETVDDVVEDLSKSVQKLVM